MVVSFWLWRLFLLPQRARICGFEWNVSTPVDWVTIKFGMDIDVSLQMNDSGNLLTFTQGSGQVLWFMRKHFPFPSALAAHESGKHDTH